MNKILTAILICIPMVAWGADGSSKDDLKNKLDKEIGNMSLASNKKELDGFASDAFKTLEQLYCIVPGDEDMSKFNECKGIIDEFRNKISWGGYDDDPQISDNNSADDEKQEQKSEAQQKVDEAQAKLDAAKEKEQSTANRMLGGLTTLATGIGGMQLAQGISEKMADSAADKDMEAYIATMRCTYGEGKTVPFSVEPVELPGGNNPELMKYRAEYVALAASLRESKTALGMKPGIEAEEILDHANMGLYDDENTGVTGGTYASRYRAAVGNEKDEKGLASAKKEAKTRMIAGGVVAGVGVVGGIIGNSIINGKLGELIKKNGDKKASDEDNKKAISKLKSKAREAGLTDPEYIDKMDLESYNIGNYIDIIDKAKLKPEVKGKKIEELCSTPAISCADKLLTEESKKEIMGEAVKAYAGI